MRVLVAFEEEYRIYMEAMQASIRAFRPEVELQVAATADAEELAAAVERAEAQLVICSPPTSDNLVDGRPARIELSVETDQLSRFRVGERIWESTNPTLGEILPVIDETKKLLRTSQEEEGQA